MVRGDLLAAPVEAIVNAANGRLAHGVRAHGPYPAGSAVVTTAGKLPFKGVIHAVGPRRGEGDEEGKLFRHWPPRSREHESAAGIALPSRLFPVESSPCPSRPARAPT